MELAKIISGRDVLVTTMPWPMVDALVIALPLSIITTLAVCLLTKAPSIELLDKSFEGV